MAKIVINVCHGCYSLSAAAQAELGVSSDYAFERDRDNPELVACVEKLGEAASGKFAELKVVEIPDDVKWFIGEHDGSEWIYEEHRTWR